MIPTSTRSAGIDGGLELARPLYRHSRDELDREQPSHAARKSMTMQLDTR
ncbi:MAG TPA: hypothetical protein VFP78_01200 [Solirubrobacteraceae bacterium]|nr:hypothetical protein [Solirubrobacteraceae bacterium]